jgi:hypothetical protein
LVAPRSYWSVSIPGRFSLFGSLLAFRLAMFLMVFDKSALTSPVQNFYGTCERDEAGRR